MNHRRVPTRLPSRDALRAGDRPAFTLMELVVVAVIMTVLAAIAAPRFAQAQASSGLRSAGYRIETDLALSLERAERLSEAHTLRFDLDAERYELVRDRAPLDDPAVATTIGDDPFGADITRVRVATVDATDLAISGHGDLAADLEVRLTRGGLVSVLLARAPDGTTGFSDLREAP